MSDVYEEERVDCDVDCDMDGRDNGRTIVGGARRNRMKVRTRRKADNVNLEWKRREKLKQIACAQTNVT